MINPITIIVADDQELFRDGLIMMLRQFKDIKVIAELDDKSELFEQVQLLNPDIVLTNVKEPGVDELACTRKLRELNPSLGIIAMSIFAEGHYIIEMLDAGANGYILKTASKKEILDAIKIVYTGKPYCCSQTTSKVANSIKARQHQRVPKPPILSERELKIIQLICSGKSNKEIAQELFLSPRTIEALRLSVQEKVHVKNPVALAIYAIESGLYNLEKNTPS